MKNSFMLVLLAAAMTLAGCGDRDNVASSATAPDATLAPSVPTDNTGWSAEPSTAAATSVDTSTTTIPTDTAATAPTVTSTTGTTTTASATST